MTVSLDWGLMLIGAWTLSGWAGGAYVTSFIADVKGGKRYEPMVRFGANLAWILLACVFVLFILDLQTPLGSPATALHLLNVLNNPITSMLSLGTYFLLFFFVFAFLTSLLWWTNWTGRLRWFVLIPGLAFAILTMFYSGFAFMTASTRIVFWKNPFLPWLLLTNSSLSGMCLVALAETRASLLFQRFSVEPFENVLRRLITYGDYLIITLILFLIGDLVYASVIERAVLGTAIGTWAMLVGPVAAVFWTLVVGIGLVFPLILSLIAHRVKGKVAQDVGLVMFLSKLVGGFFLVWAVIIAGQLAFAFPVP